MTAAPPVLSVRGLRVAYDHPLGVVRAVDGVSFDLAPGERLGLVGESGSGKSTVALALMGLLHSSTRVEGQALLDGEPLLGEEAFLVGDKFRQSLEWRGAFELQDLHGLPPGLGRDFH